MATSEAIEKVRPSIICKIDLSKLKKMENLNRHPMPHKTDTLKNTEWLITSPDIKHKIRNNYNPITELHLHLKVAHKISKFDQIFHKDICNDAIVIANQFFMFHPFHEYQGDNFKEISLAAICAKMKLDQRYANIDTAEFINRCNSTFKTDQEKELVNKYFTRILQTMNFKTNFKQPHPIIREIGKNQDVDIYETNLALHIADTSLLHSVWCIKFSAIEIADIATTWAKQQKAQFQTMSYNEIKISNSRLLNGTNDEQIKNFCESNNNQTVMKTPKPGQPITNGELCYGLPNPVTDSNKNRKRPNVDNNPKENKKSKLECIKCGATFNRKNNLRRHKKKCLIINCVKCGEMIKPKIGGIHVIEHCPECFKKPVTSFF